MTHITRHVLIPVVLLTLGLTSMLSAQAGSIKPILLDKAVLSGVGLDTIALKNEPKRAFFQKNLFRGEELGIYVVSSQTWASNFNNFWFDEFIYLFNGQAQVEPEEGVRQTFSSGDFFFAPKGFTGKWDIQAGDFNHYELSVITNKRADSTLVNTNLNPVLLDKTELSGLNIRLNDAGQYQAVLAEGVELQILFKAEQPQQRSVKPKVDQLIHVLSGQLEIIDADKEKHLFHTGDFVVLPNGFQGEQRSIGHGIIKYLVIQPSKL